MNEPLKSESLHANREVAREIVNDKLGEASASILRSLRSQGFSYGEAIDILNNTLDTLQGKGASELYRMPLPEGVERVLTDEERLASVFA